MQFIHSFASMRWPSSIKNNRMNTTTLSISQRNWWQQRNISLLGPPKSQKRKGARNRTIEDVKSFNPKQMKLLHERIIRLARPSLQENFQMHKPKLSGKRVGDLKKAFFLAGLPFPKIPKNRAHPKASKQPRNPTKVIPKGHIHQRGQLPRYNLSEDI
jgi:hypothetical protein